MKPSNRLLVFDDGWPRDFSSYRAGDLVFAALKAGHEVAILTTEKHRFETDGDFTVSIIHVPVSRRWGLLYWVCFSFIAPVKVFFTLLGAPSSRLVTFRTFFAFLATPAAFVCRVPMYLYLQSSPWRTYTRRTGSWFRRLSGFLLDLIALLFSKRVLVGAESIGREICKVCSLFESKLKIIQPSVLKPRSIDPLEESEDALATWNTGLAARRAEVIERYGLSDKSFFVATADEFSVIDSLAYLIRAIGACEDENLCLIVAGSGVQWVPLHSIAISLGLLDQIVFTGADSLSPDVLAGCDLFISPSGYRGVPEATLLALGLGIPVIASDTIENRELLVDDALLFEDLHVEALAIKLRKIRSSKEEFAKIVELSKRVEQNRTFSWGDRFLAELSLEAAS